MGGFAGRRLAAAIGSIGAWSWRRRPDQFDAGADHVCLMVRTDAPAHPGLAVYRELAAALLEVGAGG